MAYLVNGSEEFIFASASRHRGGTRFVAVRDMLFALWILASVLVLVWMCGVAGVLALGNGVHLALLVAILAVVSSLFTRPRTI